MAKNVGSSHSGERMKKRRKRERKNSPCYPVPLSSWWAALSLVITVLEMTIAWLRFSSRDSNLVCNSEMDRTREWNGWRRGVRERARLGGRGCTTEMIHVGMWCWVRHSPVICSPSYRPNQEDKNSSFRSLEYCYYHCDNTKYTQALLQLLQLFQHSITNQLRYLQWTCLPLPIALPVYFDSPI